MTPASSAAAEGLQQAFVLYWAKMRRRHGTTPRRRPIARPRGVLNPKEAPPAQQPPAAAASVNSQVGAGGGPGDSRFDAAGRRIGGPGGAKKPCRRQLRPRPAWGATHPWSTRLDRPPLIETRPPSRLGLNLQLAPARFDAERADQSVPSRQLPPVSSVRTRP